MDTTLYVGLSDQMALRRRMDIIANNLANMTTTGFKREAVLFESYVKEMEGTETPQTSEVSYVQDYGIVRDLTAGHLEMTGNPLDVAINGEAFLVVQNPQGKELYTRNGHFLISPDSELVAGNGNLVLDAGGAPISITPSDTGISIAADGAISTRERGVIGKLQLVRFENGQNMEKVGDSMYATDQVPEPDTSSSVVQGMLEASNVQPVEEMTSMIQVSRQYQTIANLLKRQDELQRAAINQLPEVK